MFNWRCFICYFPSHFIDKWSTQTVHNAETGSQCPWGFASWALWASFFSLCQTTISTNTGSNPIITWHFCIFAILNSLCQSFINKMWRKITYKTSPVEHMKHETWNSYLFYSQQSLSSHLYGNVFEFMTSQTV